LRLEEETDVRDPMREAIHRVRIASVWRQCPRLVQMWPHDLRVNSASFSPDGRYVVTACGEFSRQVPGYARVWDVTTGEAVTPPLKHGNDVTSASFSPDGRRVVTASWDNTARVWDVATGEPPTPPLQHGAAVAEASFSPDGTRVVQDGEDSTA